MILDIAIWAVPFGIVGGRIYHVITDPELYFLAGKNPGDALKIWDGGLGIWGAVAPLKSVSVKPVEGWSAQVISTDLPKPVTIGGAP